MSTIPEAKIRKILEYGVMAPSGENCQPWRFIVTGDLLKVYNIPDRDQSLYSFGQHASYFAHGALIENMSLIAKTLGVVLDIKLFPDNTDPMFVAAITLSDSLIQREPLAEEIPKRMTNRKPFKDTRLSEAQRSAILTAAHEGAAATLVLVEDREREKSIGYAASVNEEILFSNAAMHHFFFSHINWTKEEDDKKSIGFYIPTLELPGPAKPMFKIMKHWNWASLLGKIGLPKQIAKGNAKNVYATGAAHGMVAIANNNPESFVQAGRLMERIWLTVTKLGLSLQPLAGVTFLMQGITAGKREALTDEQVSKIRNAYEIMRTNYDLKNEVLVMGFRIGEADPPSAHATRLPPDVRFE